MNNKVPAFNMSCNHTVSLVVLIFFSLCQSTNGQRIIWSESTFAGPMIFQADAQGQNRDTLLLTAGVQPQDISYSNKTGILHWTDLNWVDARLNSSSLDFNNHKLHDTSYSAMRGVTSDHLTGDIYFSTTNLHSGARIYRKDAGGTRIKTLLEFTPGSTGTPHGLGYDPVNNKIYWTDFKKGTLNRATATPGSAAEEMVTGLAGPVDLVVDSKNRKVFWTEANSHSIKMWDMTNNLVTTLLDALSRPASLSIDLKERRMYWTELQVPGIYSAKLDGSDLKVHVTDTFFPSALTVVPAGLDAPENLQATDVDLNVQLTWTPGGAPQQSVQYIYRNREFNNLQASLVDSTGPSADSYLDTTALPGVFYYYWVKGSDGFSLETPFSNPDSAKVPPVVATDSHPGFLNFLGRPRYAINPGILIPYEIGKGSIVNFRIYNIHNQLIQNVSLGYKIAGNYRFRVPESSLAAGAFIYQIRAGEYSRSRCCLVITHK